MTKKRDQQDQKRGRDWKERGLLGCGARDKILREGALVISPPKAQTSLP